MHPIQRSKIRSSFTIVITLLGLATAANAQSSPLTLKVGDTGPGVESLQRRLNAKLKPASPIDIDGDFGAATKAAVEAFQSGAGLRATGLVDAKTWEALGPDPGPGPEPPSPEVVNSQPSPKAPADPLDGPPFVTAKGWVVLDAKTGRMIGGHEPDRPLDMASTTKMMTALVVLRAAKEHPGLLDETVTFSERADRTSGSTAGVKAGEKLPLRELLYGLLLPSGNDASVALGEHLGARLGKAGEGPSDPLERFVSEMNRTAMALGLDHSQFRNTHGLTAPGHQASPRDLATLAKLALEDPTFATCVATARRGCTLTDAQGRKRNVVWTNTNRLLGTEGYDGVKTGTTSAAGNCLVASGRRGGRHVIIAILGSSSADGRYADARNLFRWAWKSLGL